MAIISVEKGCQLLTEVESIYNWFTKTRLLFSTAVNHRHASTHLWGPYCGMKISRHWKENHADAYGQITLPGIDVACVKRPMNSCSEEGILYRRPTATRAHGRI